MCGGVAAALGFSAMCLGAACHWQTPRNTPTFLKQHSNSTLRRAGPWTEATEIGQNKSNTPPNKCSPPRRSLDTPRKSSQITCQTLPGAFVEQFRTPGPDFPQNVAKFCHFGPSLGQVLQTREFVEVFLCVSVSLSVSVFVSVVRAILEYLSDVCPGAIAA